VSYFKQMKKRREYAAERERHKQRYLWLREHFRFAEDSMRELWFDASIRPDGQTLPEELDRSIDAEMAKDATVDRTATDK